MYIMIIHQSHHIFQSPLVVTAHMFFNSCKVCISVNFLSFSEKTTRHLKKCWCVIKRICQQKWQSAKKQKVIMLEVKLKMNINGVIKNYLGNAGMAASGKILEMQPKKPSEGKVISVNKVLVTGRMKTSQMKWYSQKVLIKETLKN